MRTKILLLFLLGWVGMVSAQKETPNLHYDLSFDKDTIKVSDLLAKKSQIIQIDVTGKYFSDGIKQIKILKKQNELLENEANLNFYQKDVSKIQVEPSDIKFKESLYLTIKLDSLLKKDKKIVYGIVGLDGSGNEIKNNTGNLQQIVIILKKANEIKKAEIENTSVYAYFGENFVVNQEILKDKSTPESRVLNEVLKNAGQESYLGDITIPKDNQEFYFYKLNKEGFFKVDNNSKYRFKKLDIEIKDGYFRDIRVFVKDSSENIHVFTNSAGASLLFFSQFASRRYLYYAYSQKNGVLSTYSDDDLDNLYIKLTDVMSYSYKIGNHYIPHDLAIELPQDDTEKKKTNAESKATYQIKQKTDLEKIVELRTYTDFLALFGGSSNGLAQIEGKAKFYLFPYPYRFFGSKKTWGQIEVLPSVSPYVNYSRFEDKNRYVDIDSIEGIYKVQKNLNLIEKRFLTMGLDTDILKWQHKNGPVGLSLYGVLNYNLSEINIGNDSIKNIKNIKALGYGGGLHLGVKRFNNFGFDYRFEVFVYNYKNYNDYPELDLNIRIPVLKNEAEIFYHPNGNPNQAIFARLITYKERSNNHAFYQFQFGYKFAIGNRTVSAKN